MARVPLLLFLATCSRARKGRKLAGALKPKASIKIHPEGLVCCAIYSMSRYVQKRGKKLCDQGQEALSLLANLGERKLGAEALAAATVEVSLKGGVR